MRWAGLFALAAFSVLLLSACGGSQNGFASPAAVTASDRGALGVPHAASATRKRPSFIRLAAAQKPPGFDNAAKYLPSRNVKTMGQYLTRVLNRVDAFWTQQFEAAGLTDPYVQYDWLDPGASVTTACDDTTDDNTAEYCSGDDIIYISRQFAYDFWQGKLHGRTSKSYPGDFGVAYVVAHEYGHEVQAELGIQAHGATVMQLELQADCFAGVFANSEYWQGQLGGTDVQNAIGSAQLVGDYDVTNPNHHGTPEQRTAAWKLGYNSGDPGTCLDSYNP
jgi:uncharacterized protein